MNSEKTERKLLTPTTGVRRQLLTRPTTQKTKRVLLTRPTRQKAIDNMGLQGNFQTQAETMFLCWQMLSRDYSVAEIMAATGLREAFVYTLQERFRGN
jgi:hypothetical protein